MKNPKPNPKAIVKVEEKPTSQKVSKYDMLKGRVPQKQLDAARAVGEKEVDALYRATINQKKTDEYMKAQNAKKPIKKPVKKVVKKTVITK